MSRKATTRIARRRQMNPILLGPEYYTPNPIRPHMVGGGKPPLSEMAWDVILAVQPDPGWRFALNIVRSWERAAFRMEDK
jgi:hypothetical protein